MGDLHVHASGLGDGDRLAHGLEAVVGLVAHVGGVGRSVPAQHAGQRMDLVRVGGVAGRGEEPGGESPRAAA